MAWRSRSCGPTLTKKAQLSTVEERLGAIGLPVDLALVKNAKDHGHAGSSGSTPRSGSQS